MPLCKNDPKKSYKGDEPSPKGLGYCAHAEKLGVSKKGKDGNIWKIEATSKGVKRWKKQITKNNNNSKIDCSKFVTYEKKEKSIFGYTSTSILNGIEKRKGYIYKYIDFNLFEKKETKIPDGFKKKIINKKKISVYCDLNRELLLKNNELYKKIKEKFKGYKSYFIHFNGGRPFLVYIKNNDVHIYKISNNYYIRNSNWSKINDNNKWAYNEFVKSYNYKKIFIGKSPKCDMTNFSGGYGSKFDGNSILLQIDTNKYVFIGAYIYEFKIDDIINQYYSPVGNNDVPYPVALGSKNNYFMLDKTYVSNDKFKDLTKKNKIDLYSYYYGHSGYENLGKYAKKMKSVKIINEI